MRRQLYFDGRENLFGAVDTALNDPNVGIVLVRDLVTQEFIEEMAELGDSGSYERRQEILYKDVPELDAIDLYVSEWWRRNGYSDYEITDGRLHFGSKAQIGRETHVEGSSDSPVYGPVTIGFGAEGSSRVYGEKRRHRPMAPNRQFNTESFKAWDYATNPDRLPKDSVLQTPRDAVIFPQHPWVARHAVVLKTTPRSSYLFDYRIGK